MLKTVRYLIGKFWESYNKGGAREFFDDFVKYIHKKTNQYLLFSQIVPPIRLNYRDNSFSISYKNKYILDDGQYDIIPKSSDTVVEAGVAIGKDTAMFGKLAEEVIAFEPSPRQYSKAKANLKRFKNVKLINKGLWNDRDTLEIKYGGSGSEDGFLEPDKGITGTGGEIEVNSLEEYVKQLNIEEVDYLKVEAEGAEPEIIKGIGDLHIENIVVNAGEERDGEPTGREVMELLQPQGYSLVGIKKGHILFFTLNSVSHRAFRSEFE